jgi:hypothetical protein
MILVQDTYARGDKNKKDVKLQFQVEEGNYKG